MKNRKLFAILTLVAFMLTMMPVMAFATTSNQIGVWVDDANALITNKNITNDEHGALAAEKVVFGVSVPQGFDVENESLYIYATIAGTNEVYPIHNNTSNKFSGAKHPGANSFTRVTGGQLVKLNMAGEYTFEMVSGDPIQLDLHAVLVKGTKHDELKSAVKIINKYVSDGTETYANVAFDTDNTVKFTSTTPSAVVVTVTPTEVDKGEEGMQANNGVDYYELTIKAVQGNNPVRGAEIALSLDKIGAELSATTVTTNARGIAKVNVFASKAGTYKVYADTTGTATPGTAEVEFVNAAIGSVDFTEPTGVYATLHEFTIEVTGTDMNGNALSAKDVKDAVNTERAIEWVKVPEMSAFDVNKNANLTAALSADRTKALLTIRPDAEGDYTLKMYDPVTGADVSYLNFTAKKYLRTVSISVAYPAATYTAGSNVPAPTVTFVDANGTKILNKVTPSFSYTGVGVTKWGTATTFDELGNPVENPVAGAFTVSADPRFLGKEIVVNAVAENCFAATTIKIADIPAYLQFADAKAPVGTEATVLVKSLDLNGNIAALGTLVPGEPQAVVTSKPEGAVVSVVHGGLQTADFQKKGMSAIKVASNKPGTVTVNVILPIGTDKYLTGVATVTFGDEATPVNTSATLIINSNIFVANGGVQTAPAAPVIIDGRTYLPIRAVGQAIGANVEYVDGVITLTLGAQKATMVPGSNVMTIGTETVTMDAAPYLAGDGHTMVPVRYAAQAFGYSLGTTTNADGSVATVTIFK